MSWEFTQAQADQAKEINELVNSAYRGEGSKRGWTTEADLLGGQRTDSDLIREIINSENSVILVAENEVTGKIGGCVQLEKQDQTCYLGMLTVSPLLQGKGLGAEIVEEAEAFAQFWDCNRIYMTVIAQRAELITWYEDRGYQKTGETKPFPYGDEKFGLPKVDDLHFVVLQKSI